MARTKKKARSEHGVKPLFVVRLDDRGYYNEDSRWLPVPRAQASRLAHSDAERVRSHLSQPRIGYSADVEPA